MHKHWVFLEFRSLHVHRVIGLICGEKCGSWCTCLISNFYKKYSVVGNLWHYTKVIGGGVLAGGLAVAAAPLALSAAGFTAGGIAAGSFASQLMSWAAIANGGGVAAGGLVATLQSAGAAGIGFFSNLLIGSAAGTAGSALAHTLSEKPGLSEGLCEV